MNGKEVIFKSYANVYNWKVVEEDGKQVCKLVTDFPNFVKERIDFFTKQFDDGLSFLGCINFILAYDEKQCEKEFNFGASEDWLPVSKEFREWRDTPYVRREMEIAAAVMYGGYK